MTEENKMLRNKLKDIEVIAANGLANQPDGDDECGLHLMRAITKIADMSAQYAGMVEVEMYDIEWDVDDEFVDMGLPHKVSMFVRQEAVPDGLADVLSDSYGWCVKCLNYRRVS